MASLTKLKAMFRVLEDEFGSRDKSRRKALTVKVLRAPLSRDNPLRVLRDAGTGQLCAAQHRCGQRPGWHPAVLRREFVAEGALVCRLSLACSAIGQEARCDDGLPTLHQSLLPACAQTTIRCYDW